MTSLIDQVVKLLVKNHATFLFSEIKTTRNTDLKVIFYIIISMFFNDNLEAKTQRYVTRAIMKLVAAKN